MPPMMVGVSGGWGMVVPLVMVPTTPGAGKEQSAARAATVSVSE